MEFLIVCPDNAYFIIKEPDAKMLDSADTPVENISIKNITVTGNDLTTVVPEQTVVYENVEMRRYEKAGGNYICSILR